MKGIMKLEDCIKCPSFIDNRADCVLCKYGDEIEHRVVDHQTVVSCPKTNNRSTANERRSRFSA